MDQNNGHLEEPQPISIISWDDTNSSLFFLARMILNNSLRTNNPHFRRSMLKTNNVSSYMNIHSKSVTKKKKHTFKETESKNAGFLKNVSLSSQVLKIFNINEFLA